VIIYLYPAQSQATARSGGVFITPGGTQSVLASGLPAARFIIDPAPEPGSGFLLLPGSVALGARRRRARAHRPIRFLPRRLEGAKIGKGPNTFLPFVSSSLRG
jgi:hypothetical protein